MKLESLNDLYHQEIKDLYDCERQILKALPKMIKHTSNPELKEAFEEHLEQTEGHVARLERIFEMHGMPAKGKKCKGVLGIIDEGSDYLDDNLDENIRDAGLISAGQRVEHYEMASYGCARTFARMLGEDEAADLLEQTLNEEKEADRRLTQVAESSVNPEALSHVGA